MDEFIPDSQSNSSVEGSLNSLLASQIIILVRLSMAGPGVSTGMLWVKLG